MYLHSTHSVGENSGELSLSLLKKLECHRIDVVAPIMCAYYG